jgi:hypothetical protein
MMSAIGPSLPLDWIRPYPTHGEFDQSEGHASSDDHPVDLEPSQAEAIED